MSQTLSEQAPCATTRQPRREDQRRWPRTEHRRTFVVHPMDDGQILPPIATRAHNFSTMGVGLIHARRMAVGDQFVLPLATQNGPAIPLLYTVIRCRALSNGLYSIGAQLVSLLDFQDFAKQYPNGDFSRYMHESMMAEQKTE